MVIHRINILISDWFFHVFQQPFCRIHDQVGADLLFFLQLQKIAGVFIFQFQKDLMFGFPVYPLNIPVVHLECDQDTDHDQHDLTDGVYEVSAESVLGKEFKPDLSEEMDHL